MHDLQQGEMIVTRHFNVLSWHWQQLDKFEELEWDCPRDRIMYKKIHEKKRTFKFLLGLNKNLDEVCGRILGIR